MGAFALNPTGYVIGRRIQEGDSGFDVQAFQKGLIKLGHGLPQFGPDGYYGKEMLKAVREFQARFGLTVDGWAGPASQREAALMLIWPVQKHYGTPPGLIRGGVAHESSFLFGNHPPQYDDDSWDAGLTQQNTKQQQITITQAMDPITSLDKYAKILVERFTKYRGYGVIKDDYRLWSLASGSWNRPAWTDTLAQGKKLTDAQRDWIEAYMFKTTRFLVV